MTSPAFLCPIDFSEKAQNYLGELIAKQATGTSVRVFVSRPGTLYAETYLSYCKKEEEVDSEVVFEFSLFNLRAEEKDLPYLEDAEIDFQDDEFGGQLTIKAPKAKLAEPDETASLFEKISYFLQAEISPALAGHGGNVELEDYLEQEGIVVLRFGGGCQGCGMISVTLREGIESQLKAKFPEVREVRDVTDHSQDENAYYAKGPVEGES